MQTQAIVITHNGTQAMQNQSRADAFGRLRGVVAATAIGLSLAFGSLAFATPADARISGARTTDLEKFCGSLQDSYDQLYAEVHNPATTPERRQDILNTMQNIGILWDFNCKGQFGKISSRLMPVFDPVVQVVDMAPTMGTEPNDAPALSQDTKIGLANRFNGLP